MTMQRMIATAIYHAKCLKTINSSSSYATFCLIIVAVSSASAIGRHDVRNCFVSPILRPAKFEHIGVYVVGWQSGVSPYFGQIATQTADS